MSNYWHKLARKRTGRRSVLAAGAAAAFLAACGRGPAPGPKDPSGLLTFPEDTTRQAKVGGTLVSAYLRDPLHFDGQAQGQAQLNIFNQLAYSSLVRNKPGYKEPSTNTEVLPNMAESWEVSLDKTQLSFKLRPAMKWHDKPPINGRQVDALDVVASWERYVSLPANNAVSNANSLNPAAPILSYSAPDARTVVIRLKEPNAFILQRLANMVTGELGTVMPKETGSSFDPRAEQIGCGGFVRERFQPSVGADYVRNADYFDKDNAPHIQRVEMRLISEYATGLAQLKAGGLLTYGVRPEDSLTVKREVPQLNMYTWTAATATPGATIRFGWLSIQGEKSPFLDIRVRQALSLALDRETYIDTFGDITKLRAEGIPVETYYYVHMGYLPGWTLDPRNEREFGPNARFYKYDPAEARKLLEAAGYGGTRFPAFPSHHVGPPFSDTYRKEASVLDEMARDVGFKPEIKHTDYNLEYLRKIVTSRGQYEGWAYAVGAVSSPHPVDFFAWRYWSKAGPTSGALGHDRDGRGDMSGDPEADAMIEKAMAEFDVTKQRSIVHDLQRYLSKMQYTVTRPGFGDTFQFAWPALRNFQVWQGDSRGGGQYNWWIDATRPPLVKT